MTIFSKVIAPKESRWDEANVPLYGMPYSGIVYERRSALRIPPKRNLPFFAFRMNGIPKCGTKSGTICASG